MFIASVCSFNAEIKVHEWILLIVSAAVLLGLVQMTGVTGGGGHAFKFLSWWAVTPTE